MHEKENNESAGHDCPDDEQYRFPGFAAKCGESTQSEYDKPDCGGQATAAKIFEDARVKEIERRQGWTFARCNPFPFFRRWNMPCNEELQKAHSGTRHILKIWNERNGEAKQDRREEYAHNHPRFDFFKEACALWRNDAHEETADDE